MRILKKLLVALGTFIILLGILFLFRVPILHALGNVLICEEPVEKVQAIFVLSGGPLDRGGEAAKLYGAGISKRVICTGSNTPADFAALGITYLESEITRIYMMHEGVPDSSIDLIKKGTSTREEEECILDYCKKNNLNNVMVVSSKFHTRRICRTFNKAFSNAHIHLIIHGASSSTYDENNWWKREDGLIAVNNEYIKILYYWVKY